MTLDCRDITALLDDYLDRQLDAVRQQALDEHLQHCPQCCLRRDRAAMVQTALHDLPAPASRPGFVNEALARAGRGADGGARYARRPLFAMALAASLALAVGVVVLVGTQPGPAPTPTPVQIVTLTVEQPETLRLRFNSAKALPAATLSLTLPENLELVGYGAQRELTWQTDLNEGGNLLQLPLVARGAVEGDLVARLSHGQSSKTFRLKIEVRNADQTGLSPAGLAT
jgi:putative zinc finger protein